MTGLLIQNLTLIAIRIDRGESRAGEGHCGNMSPIFFYGGGGFSLVILKKKEKKGKRPKKKMVV